MAGRDGRSGRACLLFVGVLVINICVVRTFNTNIDKIGILFDNGIEIYISTEFRNIPTNAVVQQVVLDVKDLKTFQDITLYGNYFFNYETNKFETIFASIKFPWHYNYVYLRMQLLIDLCNRQCRENIDTNCKCNTIRSSPNIFYGKEKIMPSRYHPRANDNCLPSETQVSIGTVCAGEVILDESFDDVRLKQQTWRAEQYFPTDHPDHPFVAYHNKQHEIIELSKGQLILSVKNNDDAIKNKSLLISTSGYTDLTDYCTKPLDQCIIKPFNNGMNIAPPLIAPRITTPKLGFKYGIISIIAKFPIGDWLYPEILLEPYGLKKYGSDNSGQVIIASARGNRQLSLQQTSYGNDVLYGGPIANWKCREQLLKSFKVTQKLWGDDFHNYTLHWKSDGMFFYVDGHQWWSVHPDDSSLSNCNETSELERVFLSKGSKMAPFDQLFTLKLGLGVGGITEFPDEARSGSYVKPWHNSSPRAIKDFWAARDDWLPTWTQNFIIDHIKITAL